MRRDACQKVSGGAKLARVSSLPTDQEARESGREAVRITMRLAAPLSKHALERYLNAA